MMRGRLKHPGDLSRVFNRVHFVGIGGVGMSGIAEVMLTLGYAVSGSDAADNATTQRLASLGAAIHRGHRAEHVGDVDALVVSSAIKADNPELIEARARRIPVVPRAEMLAELMRFKRGIAIAGTHGKTTTTSLVASVLSEGGLDPTFVIGGKLLSAGANARLGGSEWLVAEADESDGSFLRLNPLVAVVTNIDADHLENYGGDFERVKQAFDEFLHRLPFYGLAVLCIDDPEVAMLATRTPRHVLRYGFAQSADVRASEVTQQGQQMHFLLHLPGEAPMPMALNLPGRHNVQNALAAIAVGTEMGLPDESIRSALASFKGVKRRFTRTGEAGGIAVIDDYGHHPVEIAAVLKAARQAGARDVIAVVQPHRYSRLASLFEEFCTCMNDAGTVIIADVYAAGEAPVEGIDRDALVEGLRTRGHRSVVPLPGPESLAGMVNAIARSGDYVVCLGAGSITTWANALPGELAALQAAVKRA